MGAVTLASDLEAGTGAAGQSKGRGGCGLTVPSSLPWTDTLTFPSSYTYKPSEEWEGGVKIKRIPACHMFCTQYFLEGAERIRVGNSNLRGGGDKG